MKTLTLYRVVMHYRDAGNYGASSPVEEDVYYENIADAEHDALARNEANDFEHDGYYNRFTYGVEEVELSIYPATSRTSADVATRQVAALETKRLAELTAAEKREAKRLESRQAERDRIFREEAERRGLVIG